MPKLGRTHGTRSCYVGGCRQPECVEATRAYWQQYSSLIRAVAGSDQSVDPSPAIKHIRYLREHGVGRRAIAKAAGMDVLRIFEIDHEYHKHIRRSTEQKILSVTLDASFLVPATGTRRRLQGLAAIGYTLDALADELESSPVVLARVTGGRNQHVQRATAEKVTVMFDRLSMTPGPSAIAKIRALAKGWAPPMAWDEDEIDDPKAKPSGVLKEVVPLHLDLEEWESLVKSGESVERATERCESSLTAVERAAHRAGRTDLAAMAAHARKRYAA